jgi:hypothetical protein
MKRLSAQELFKHVDMARVAELEQYLCEMNLRGLADHYGLEYTAPVRALAPDVMYFQSLVLAPSDRRMLARDIIGVAHLSPEDKVCNASLSYWYGPTYILTYITGVTDTAKAHIDFDRVYSDQAYVDKLRENIAFARKHGHPIWTTTELHTSIQTEGRNYCRLKYNDPNRKADSLDIVEWIAHLKQQGWASKVIAAPTLVAAYEAYCEPRGVGPYFGGNSIMMAANLREAAYSHEENFCAPGGGAISTLEYLFEPLKAAGYKLNHLRLLQWLTDEQERLMPSLKVPVEFQNLDGWTGKILKKDQLRYTANSFEVGCCQFSVYRKFLEQPDAIKRRLDVKFDLTPFKLREQGATDADVADAVSEETKLRTDLLEF